MTVETSNKATVSHYMREQVSVPHRDFEVRMILPEPPDPEIITIGGMVNSSSYYGNSRNNTQRIGTLPSVNSRYSQQNRHLSTMRDDI